MERMSGDVNVLRVKDSASIHERGQVSGYLLGDVPHEELAEERHANGIWIVRIIWLSDHCKPADVGFGESFDVVLSVAKGNARRALR